MTTETTPRLALVVADPLRIAGLRAEDVPALLGQLEELRATLWARMVRPPAPAADNPAAAAVADILTVPDVARELRFTSAYVYEAVRRGDLAAVRKGKYLRIRRADLRAWLDGRAPAKALDQHPVSRDSSAHAPSRAGSTCLSARGARVSARIHARPETSDGPDG